MIRLEKEIIKQMGSIEKFFNIDNKSYEVSVENIGKLKGFIDKNEDNHKFYLEFIDSDNNKEVLYDKTCNTNVESIKNQIYSTNEAKECAFKVNYMAMEYEFMKCILYKFLNFKYDNKLDGSFILNYIRSEYKCNKNKLSFTDNLGVLMFEEQKISSYLSLKAYSVDSCNNYYKPYELKEYNIELLSEINKKEKVWNISFNDFPYGVYSNEELKDKQILDYKKLGDLCFNISLYCFELLEIEFKCFIKYYMITIL